MRSLQQPLNRITPIPDTIGSAIITTAGAVVAQDWPTGAKAVSFDASMAFITNMVSTFATVPTTNSAGTTASSGQNVYQPAGHEHTYQIPSSSTGYSVTAPTSGVVTISFWAV